MEQAEMRFVRGNDVTLLVNVKIPVLDSEGNPVINTDGGITFAPCNLDTFDEWKLSIARQGIKSKPYAVEVWAGEEEGTIVVMIPYTLPCGTYALEFTASRNGQHARSYELVMFGIVENNGDANVTFDVVEGERSFDIDLSVQYVSQSTTRGKNAYELWREMEGNEDKTLQDYIDEVLDLTTITENARHPDYVGEDNYVYRWDTQTQSYYNTDIYVKGEQGEKGDKGDKGDTGQQGIQGPAGQNGLTPTIDSTSKHWMIGSTDTGVVAEGQDGQDGQNGTNGTNGVDGVTPHIDSSNKHWMIGSEDTGVVAEGQNGRDGTNGTNGTNGTDGADGITPHIDSTTGNWFIGEQDTGVHAQGPQGVPGVTPDISGKEDKVDIVSASGATLTAEVGKYYTLSNVGTLAITLPTIAAGTTKVQTVTFYIAAGSTPAVTWDSTHTIIFSDGFLVEANGLYEISAAWNGIGWFVGMIKFVAPSS